MNGKKYIINRRNAAIRDMRNREVENFDNSTQKQIQAIKIKFEQIYL